MSEMASQSEAQTAAEKARLIAAAMWDYDITKFRDVWEHLARLSDETELDGVDVNPAGVLIDNGRFNGLMTVYLVFRFKTDRGEVVSPEALPGEFQGHFDSEGRPQIDSVSVDDSLFFE